VEIQPNNNFYLYAKDEFLWPSVYSNLSVIVFGNYHHFLGSMLSKTLNKFGVSVIDGFEAYNSNPERVISLARKSTLIKWEPIDPYIIPSALGEVLRGCHIINNTHFNSAKSNVFFYFRRAFGYDLSVNPSEFSGEMVIKSDMNAAHDGQVEYGPISDISPNKTYSLLVDNTVDDGRYVRDLRIPVIGGDIPFAYIKYRTIDMRFQTDSSFAKLVELYEVFSNPELSMIKNFCELIGLEYGELDILRDRKSRKIYIVDVNNTPYGPPQQAL